MPRRASQKQTSPPAFSGDPAELPPHVLDALYRLPDPAPALIVAFCRQRLSVGAEADCLAALQRHEPTLLDGADPERLADVVLGLPGAAVDALPSQFFLRLGARLERAASYDQAIQIYYRLGETKAHSFDFEAALWRLARLAEEVYADPQQAGAFYAEMRRLFPDGRWSAETPPEAAR